MLERIVKNLARIGTAAVLSTAVLATASCDKPAMLTGARTDVTFAVLSVEQSQNLQKLWGPLFTDMEKQTGLKVHPFYSSSYTALIEAMRFNQVQAAWFSNASGLEAMKRAHGEVFAHTTYPDGQEGYYSIIIAPKNSKLNNADDLLKCNKTLNFGLGDVKSTSGYVAPMAYLFLPHHTDINTCFKNLKSGSSHQTNFEGVVAGVLDAATNNSTALVELNATPEGAAKVAKIKVIWQSPLLPTDVVEYRTDLDPATKEKLRSFFLSYGTAAGPEGDRQRAILKGLVWGPLKPDDNSHFLPERRMEASVAMQQAIAKHDAAGIKAAQAEIDAVAKDQAALSAHSASQAPADPSPAASSQ